MERSDEPPLKKGCSRACLAVGRLVGSRLSRTLTKSLASSLMPSQYGHSRLSGSVRMDFLRGYEVKGGNHLSRSMLLIKQIRLYTLLSINVHPLSPDCCDCWVARAPLVIKRESPSQQLVRHDASRPYITGRPHLTGQDLGGHKPAEREAGGMPDECERAIDSIQSPTIGILDHQSDLL